MNDVARTQLTFQITSIRQPIPGIWLFRNIWPWKSKVKVIAQLYRLTSLLLHENQPSNSWHTLFQNLTLKIQGQGHGWGKMLRSHNQPSIHSMYRQVSNIRRTKSKHLKILVLSYGCLCRIPCWVENEDVVGAAPTGDAPITSEWSTILLPTKMSLILEVLL